MGDTDILHIEDHLWVLEENGANVLLKDCLKFRISRQERIAVFTILLAVVRALRDGEPLDAFIDVGALKRLDRQDKTREHELWEARDEARGTRIIFVLKRPDAIIVSAVSKVRGSLSNAVNRGANRWQNYLRQKEK